MSIVLENVSYTYSPDTAYEIHALKQVSLEIRDGQYIGLIGHTRSGQATLGQPLHRLVQTPAGPTYLTG